MKAPPWSSLLRLSLGDEKAAAVGCTQSPRPWLSLSSPCLQCDGGHSVGSDRLCPLQRPPALLKYPTRPRLGSLKYYFWRGHWGNGRINIAHTSLCTSSMRWVCEGVELVPEARVAFPIWSPGAQVHSSGSERAVCSSCRCSLDRNTFAF